MKKNLHKKLNCIGFYGFGSGWGHERGYDGKDSAMYCNGCVAGKECWEKHKLRVAGFTPDLVAEFEKRAKTVQGPELVKQWMDEFGMGDPYTHVMLGNIEDGGRVASGFQPTDREDMTLSWPLQERIQ